jgi:hypothetical protein
MAKKAIKVKEWIRTGEIEGNPKTQARIIEQCGSLLDGASACEIIGEVLFKGTDGKYYAVTVEAVIGEASKSFVKDVLATKAEEDIMDGVKA